VSVGRIRPKQEPDFRGLAMAGHRVLRTRSEPKCKCCHGDVRDNVEKWFLQRKLGLEDEVSHRLVTMDWMVQEAPKRLGVAISSNSFRSHYRNHFEIVRDTTLHELPLTEAEEVQHAVVELDEQDLARREEDGGYEPGAHQRFLEEVVQMGRARIRANPAAVTVDHALAAAKELSRLKQDENRAELIRALAQAGAVRIGPAEVQHQLEAEVSELVEA